MLGNVASVRCSCTRLTYQVTLKARTSKSISPWRRRSEEKEIEACDCVPDQLMTLLTQIIGKTNPEELFSAGYGACFQSAMNAVAAKAGVKMPTKPEDSIVETTVHLVGSMKELDMSLRVEMLVKVKGLDKEQLEKVVYEARQVCPYSRATKDNVYTTIRCETM